MSDTINPYESTQTNLDKQKPLVSQDFFTESMIENLKASSPWIKFIGVISFISAGIIVIIGIFILLLLPVLSRELDFSASFLSGFAASAFGFIYLIMGIIMIFPAKYLCVFASKINLFVKTKNEQAMEIALKNNTSYWKFYGVLAIISLASIPVIFIISIIVALAGLFL